VQVLQAKIKIMKLKLFIVIMNCLLFISCKTSKNVGNVYFSWKNETLRPNTIDGCIYDKTTNAPLSGVSVTVTSTSGDISDTTDKYGKFSLGIGEAEITNLRINGKSLNETISCLYGIEFTIFIDKP
jgi:hypothetical protein